MAAPARNFAEHESWIDHPLNDSATPWEVWERHPAVGFVNTYVSVSRLEAFENCPRKFFYRYVVKLDESSTTDSRKADIGVVVHGAIDRVYKWVIAEEFTGSVPAKIIEAAYRDEYKENERELPDSVSYVDGLTLVRNYFDRYPDADHWEIIESEQEFLIEIEPGVWVKGFMDLVRKIDDETIEVTDYKTNANLYTSDDLDENLQASVYLMMAKTLWPWAKKFKFRFEMLRHNRSQFAGRTAEQLDVFRQYTIDLVERIEKPFQPWRARLSTLCGWCPYRSSCPEFMKAETFGDAITRTDDDGLIEISVKRERLAKVIKALEVRKRELEKALKSVITPERPEIRLPGVTYREITINKTVYPLDEAVEVLVRYSGKTEAEILEALTDKYVDKKRMETFLATIRDDLSRVNRSTMLVELAAIVEQTFWFSRFDSKLDKRPELSKGDTVGEIPELPKPKPQLEASQECSFCGKSPAKQVTRGGGTFNVCQEHSRKRKPPAE